MCREMKDSDVAWIGEIPSTWELLRFKDKYINKKEIAREKSSEYERIALTLNGVVKRPKDDSEGLQPKDFDTYQILEENDFVFKMIDLQNISTSRVGLSPYTGLVSPAYIRFSPKDDNENTKYMYYYLISLYYNCVFNNLGGDGVRSALNAKDMGQFMCPYPSKDEQKAIVSLLDRKCVQIDELIFNQEKQIEKLKAYKQSLITEVVTKGLNPDAEMKDSGIKRVGFFPSHWKIVKFKNVATLCNGKEVTTEDGTIPVYGSGGVFKYTDKPLHTGESLLMGRKGTIDNPILVNGDFWTVDTMFYTSEFKNVIGKYLYYCCCGIIDYGYYKSGSVLPSMTQTEINNISITYPPLSEQEKIVEYLDIKCAQIENLISIKENKVIKLNEYKKSLIYEYVTGKKQVI